MLTQENTRGYTDDELAALNQEWSDIVEIEQLELDTDEYHARYKTWCDSVSKRRN
jgi:hypothetical protein